MNERLERVASYRIQLTPSFGFAETIGLLDHLDSLGISHLYLSPIAEAIPGSEHGYDVVDHTRVRSEFGGEQGVIALLDAAFERGMGVLIDHVPNHMSVALPHLNTRWWEMLRDGPGSAAAQWFDVDWDGADGQVIVPKLGDPLEEVLARRELVVGDGDLGPELRYGPLRFPLASGTERLDVAEAVERQHYRLQCWREPARNVRRFFTVDDLVAVCAEQPDVATVIDSIPARLASHPAFAGVRVDHVDGLAQPEAYLHGLRSRVGAHRWLLVEKILAVGEVLAPSWPVDGTTGYDHIRVSDHVVLDPGAEQPLTELWNDLTGDRRSFGQVEEAARREVLDGGLRPDLDRLVRAIATDGSGDDEQIRRAVIELTIGVHRYRTYLPDDAASVVELDAAFERAATHRPGLRDDLALLVDVIRRRPAIATRWEQLCSPVMAKGAEDRAFYRYLRLASLCEVGGAPGQWSLSVGEFHRHQIEAQAVAPSAMLAGTTHDTKRSEGVRARALAVAEIADDWCSAVRSWIDDRAELVADLDPATVLLALETAVTAWPIDAERLTEYLVKSAREAELHTSWTAPDEAYEAALGRLAACLSPGLDRDGPAGLSDVSVRIARPGWANSLSALAIRLTAPGVPDLYQGTAAFTYSLVDPDNRAEPDWAERRELVRAARALDGPGSWNGDDPETSKAVVVTRLLELRRHRAAAFGVEAGYLPLAVTGEHAEHVLAFARTDGAMPLVVTIVVIRSLGVESWANTSVTLPDGAWRDVLADAAAVVDGGAPVALSNWLERFPVAVLTRTDR
jgi:(1->4)-alpha-D-glucan 1-alpha-D-glucosylmutase